MVYKPQQQINDCRQSESYQQRYQTINTAYIPPLMSVRSDINTTAKLHYNNRYNYSNEHYQQQRPTNNTHSKCDGASLIRLVICKYLSYDYLQNYWMFFNQIYSYLSNLNTRTDFLSTKTLHAHEVVLLFGTYFEVIFQVN
ncbi:unnamed protein product [Adineta steineri]|uniref:Uncharacterized protein n=1 Tax=Adineta steineri TaxID=433720 RepID=A0A814X8W0_9BILA|nr:unnamed protein product [Adineta steineri]CAF1495830.1 unnamed protein product [Adineta steineri]